MTRNLLILRCLKNKLRKEKKKSIFFDKKLLLKRKKVIHLHPLNGETKRVESTLTY